ncbi:GNAT family N-acetyltransferase [Paenibacillus melissococcoides]|uniref:GNAT family N-acetyltransferase n=1 Tax=Paenibacillus melissococcoides TaxID=2912268 RepID=A0ABM9FXN3_9BACL|nr:MULTISPECIES: GNAT family N-acetyltransferase [Paenibacillus]MEB9894269.1 GNAT family N-acetyltransferase [Bacillus cereus]CAH8243936.1 GNAT family N-acetyltransferase [Paenibacillus melissococcoides]CAH8704176.1 GNAT family N-acetyltransferase [Paenibacillus melissococcoides]CAH8706926.1 GNAT family N-acetyltransferase [Paenibacillus melissococcoides]GIO80145.1 N-acetyltransferase [Paenibacillus dendritiformis]
MFINVKPRLREAAIRELVELSVFPDPDKVEAVLKRYEQHPDHELWGYESEGEVAGIIGFRKQGKEIEILHLAVHPELRGAGFGRGMILELIHQEQPDVLKAETDEEAVDFYRNIGFRIESRGEIYPGAERFTCTYETDPEEQ